MHNKIDWTKYHYKSLGRVDFTFFFRGVLSSFGHREDTANMFVVNALRCQNSIRSSCRRCMKEYFCVKMRTKGSFILSYINYSIKPFICYVELYHKRTNLTKNVELVLDPEWLNKMHDFFAFINFSWQRWYCNEEALFWKHFCWQNEQIRLNTLFSKTLFIQKVKLAKYKFHN